MTELDHVSSDTEDDNLLEDISPNNSMEDDLVHVFKGLRIPRDPIERARDVLRKGIESQIGINKTRGVPVWNLTKSLRSNGIDAKGVTHVATCFTSGESSEWSRPIYSSQTEMPASGVIMSEEVGTSEQSSPARKGVQFETLLQSKINLVQGTWHPKVAAQQSSQLDLIYTESALWLADEILLFFKTCNIQPIMSQVRLLEQMPVSEPPRPRMLAIVDWVGIVLSDSMDDVPYRFVTIELKTSKIHTRPSIGHAVQASYQSLMLRQLLNLPYIPETIIINVRMQPPTITVSTIQVPNLVRVASKSAHPTPGLSDLLAGPGGPAAITRTPSIQPPLGTHPVHKDALALREFLTSYGDSMINPGMTNQNKSSLYLAGFLNIRNDVFSMTPPSIAAAKKRTYELWSQMHIDAATIRDDHISLFSAYNLKDTSITKAGWNRIFQLQSSTIWVNGHLALVHE